MRILWCLLPLILAGCPGVQSNLIDQGGKQGGHVVVLTPEQTDTVRQMLTGQLPSDCPTAVIAGVKDENGKTTLIVRCE